jgi:hypothetical protein
MESFMSLVNLLVHGTGGAQASHLRTEYQSDSFTTENRIGRFDGHAFTNEEDESRTSTIDGVIRVSTVADQVRKDHSSFWNHQRKTSLALFATTLIGGIAAAVAAAALVVLCPPLLGVAIAVGVISLTVLGFSGFAYYRHSQAADQFSQWQDPLPGIIRQRQRAGKEGFEYVHARDLKGKSVTPGEVEGFWHTKMETFQQSFLQHIQGVDSIVPRKLRDFFNADLLGEEKLAYAFSDFIPLEVQHLAEQYRVIKEQYSSLKTLSKELQRAIKREKTARLAENDRQKNTQLALWTTWYDQYRHPVVIHTYRRAGRPALVGGRQVPGHSPVTVHYPGVPKAKLEACFVAMTAPIYALHGRNRQLINQWAARELKSIKQKEREQVLSFLNPIQHLLCNYRRPAEAIPQTGVPYEGGQQGLYPMLEPTAPPFDQEFSPLYPDLRPSAPPLDSDYQPPAYNLEWNDVIPQTEWYRVCCLIPSISV